MKHDVLEDLNLSAYRRIMIIGAPGSGKSRAARRLASITGLPLIHLDNEYWLPDNRHVEGEEWQSRVAGLAEGESWIIDGNYSGTMEIRLCRAELAVCLDPPPLVSLMGVLSRRGKPRPDMPDHFVEKLDRDYLEFCIYSLTFRRRKLPQVLRLCEMYPEVPLLHLKSHAQTDAFLDAAERELKNINNSQENNKDEQ